MNFIPDKRAGQGKGPGKLSLKRYTYWSFHYMIVAIAFLVVYSIIVRMIISRAGLWHIDHGLLPEIFTGQGALYGSPPFLPDQAAHGGPLWTTNKIGISSRACHQCPIL